MVHLIILVSIILEFIVGLALIIWILIYILAPSINGKEHIEMYMTDKYGPNWFDEMIEGLRDPEVRKSISDELKLKK